MLREKRLRKTIQGVTVGMLVILISSIAYAATQGTFELSGAVRRNEQIGIEFSQPQCDPGGDASECSVTLAQSGKVFNFDMRLENPGDAQTVSFCLTNVGTVNATTGFITSLVAPSEGIIVTPPFNVDDLTITPREEICSSDGQPFSFHVEWDANMPDDFSVISFSYRITYLQDAFIWDDSSRPDPFTPMISRITQTSFQVDGLATGGVGVLNYYFSIDDGVTWTGATTASSYRFNGLTPDTFYTVRVRAVDRVGQERISESVSVRTLEAANIDTGGGSWTVGGRTVYQFSPMSITYTGTEATRGWEITVAVPDDAVLETCSWNARCTLNGGILTINNTAASAAISPGATFEIGFQFNSATAGYQLNIISTVFFSDSSPNPNEVVITDGLTHTLTSTGGWGNVGAYTLVLRNDSGISLDTWEAAITRVPGMSLAGGWGAIIAVRDDLIVFTPNTWQMPLLPGATISIGLQIERSPGTVIELAHFFGRTAN